MINFHNEIHTKVDRITILMSRNDQVSKIQRLQASIHSRRKKLLFTFVQLSVVKISFIFSPIDGE